VLQTFFRLIVTTVAHGQEIPHWLHSKRGCGGVGGALPTDLGEERDAQGRSQGQRESQEQQRSQSCCCCRCCRQSQRMTTEQRNTRCARRS